MKFSSRWSWLALSAVTAGLIIHSGDSSQAWQERRVQRELDDDTLIDEPKRGAGFIELQKCHVKLIDTVVLASDRPGVISYLEAEEGDAVRKDQQVVGFKDEAAQAIYKVAKQKSENDVHIRFAKASADVAKKEYEKNLQANMKVPGTVTAVEIERSRLNWEKAILQGEQAEHEQLVAKLEMEKAAEDLKTYKITAPFDGKVRRILKRPGEAVSQGTPILDMVSTRRVKVEGYLPIEDAWSVKAGDSVDVRVDIPGRELPIENEVFEGKVVFVDPTVSPVTHGTRIWAEVQNPGERLIEGLYAKMKIKFGARGTARGERPSAIKPVSGNR